MVVSLKLMRQLLGVVWLLAVIGLLALSSATHLAGFFDRQLFIVRGASMAPAIPLGALITVAEVSPDNLKVGDVVTVRTDAGAIVTHRIIELRRSEQSELMLRTQGDASESADAILFPTSAVIGEVEAYAPYAGFLLAYVSMPSGLISVLAALGALLVARWTLEAKTPTRRQDVPAPMTQASPNPGG